MSSESYATEARRNAMLAVDAAVAKVVGPQAVNRRLTPLELREIAKAAAAASVEQLRSRLELVEAQIVAKREAKRAERQAVAKQLIDLHSRLVAAEVRAGIRSDQPIQKAGASLADQLRAIVEDTPQPVRKAAASLSEQIVDDNPRRVRKNGSTWEGFLS